MSYRLGVDLGTTFTAAAVANGGPPTMLGLGNRALQVPSVLYLPPDGEVVVGEAAERRGLTDPSRVVREFKRRIGDHVPILVAGAPYSPQALTARLLHWVVRVGTEQLGEPPAQVILTYPANWGPYKRELLTQIVELADVGQVTTCSEPEAAAVQYAAKRRVPVGTKIAMYDLGGGTFDTCILEKRTDGFVMLGEPIGIEHLGGIDFDDAVFQHVWESLDGVTDLDPADPAVQAGLSRLRRDCVEAKEALSSDVEAIVPVTLPGWSTSIRLTRSELEELVRPPLTETVAAVGRAMRSAGVEPSDLYAIVLVGGGSRIPLVRELLQQAYPVRTALDTHPKHDVALGAVQVGTLKVPPPSQAPPPSKASPTSKGSPGPTVPPTPERPTAVLPGRPAPEPPSPVTPADPPPATVADPAPEPTPAPKPEPEPPTLVLPVPVTAADPAPGFDDILSAGRVPPRGSAGAPGEVGDRATAIPRHAVPETRAVPNRDPAPAPNPTPTPDPDPTPAPTPTPDDGAAPGSGPRGRLLQSRLVALGCVLVALVFALVAIRLNSGDDPRDAGRGPTGGRPLPVSAPLTDRQLLVPMKIGENTDIYLADTGRNAPVKRLTSSPGSDSAPALSPDRRSAVYVHHEGTRTLRVMAVDGTGDRKLFDPVPSVCKDAFRPAWNPVDPTMLAIACTDGQGASGLYLVRTDGRVLRKLPVGQPLVDDPTFSPDGRRVAYWAGPKSSLDGGSIYSIPVAGGGPRQLTTSAAGIDADPAWSPNGNFIAFRRRLADGSENGNFDIFVVPSDGSQGARVLISGIYDEQDPSWSPGGDQLAIKSDQLITEDDSTDRARIWIVKLAGTTLRQLWTSEADGEQSAPAWSRR